MAETISKTRRAAYALSFSIGGVIAHFAIGGDLRVTFGIILGFVTACAVLR